MAARQLERPQVGDELIVYRKGGRNAPPLHQVVRVAAVARYRVTLEALPGDESLPWYLREFDLRTGMSWQGKDWTLAELHTEDTLAYRNRRTEADSWLTRHGVWTHELRGDLRAAASADPVAFAEALRAFIKEAGA